MPRLARHWLEFTVLWSLGLCLPIFQVLDDSPDYLVALHAGFPELPLAVLVLVLAPPTVGIAVEWVAHKISERASELVHLGALTGLVAIYFLQVLKDQFDPTNRALAVVALVIGAGFAYLYTRGRFLPTVLAFLSPAALIVLVWFLALSTAAPRAWGHSDPTVEGARSNGTPVVLVIFDEFSGLSLIDENGHIKSRFPNFARLAARSTWYRNASTVADQTTEAVPAILSGQLKKKRLPTAANYPRNVFSLLRGQFRRHVREPITYLCESCDEDTLAERAGRLRRSLWDLIKQRLRPADPENFLNLPLDALRGRDDAWRDWQAGITGGRALNVMHIELPHSPWWYSARGDQYATEVGFPPGVVDNELWTKDARTVAYYQRRYLNQVQFTDRLVGELMNEPIWDRALVVFVADHGVAFRPGVSRRIVARSNLAEVGSVPLFVKAPGQTRGRTSNELATTLDVFPTIGDWLGTNWSGEGQSLRQPVKRRNVGVSSSTGPGVKATGPQFTRLRAEALRRLAAAP